MNPLAALGGGGLSASASSSTGAQGGDSFNQNFGGVNINKTPWYLYVIMAVVLLGMGFMALKVFA